MRILSLSFAAAALALAFTPAVQAQQENTSRVRQAWLRMQARQQEVRHKERVLAKAQEWAARRDAQNQREDWIVEHAPHLAAAPQRAELLRPSSPQEFMQIRQMLGDDKGAVQRARGGNAAMGSGDQVVRPRSRKMVKAMRDQLQSQQGGKVFRPKAMQAQGRAGGKMQAQGQAGGKVFRPKAQAQRQGAASSQAEAPRRAVRSAGGAMRSADQPRSGGAARSQGGRGR